MNTNYFGTRRVNEVLGKYVARPGGRIVNIASASGPNFVNSLPEKEELKGKLAKPWTITGGVAELDEIAKTYRKTDNGYGLSKALVNAYTFLQAKEELGNKLIVNACTPGYILTDMTQGHGATNPPEKGAVPPCFLLLDDSLANAPPGRYYGSDCVRSPIDCYRGPGDAPYVNDDDLAELGWASAAK